MELLTSEEKERLEKKLADRIGFRPVITKRIAEARAMGDLKENAEYHAARDDQGLNEAEIRRLEQKIKTSNVIDDSQVPDGLVFLGSVVRLKDISDDDEDLYKLVGEATGNFDADEIEVTIGSPMGQALMKSRVGEVVKVDLPRGTKRYEILEII